MTRRFFEDDKSVSSKGAGSSITIATPTDMDMLHTQDPARVLGPRPTLTSHHSSSLPTTPYQRPRTLSFGVRAPSPGPVVRNTSPRSSHSESNQSLPALRKRAGGCKYETGMAQARRRFPYSLGPEKLGPEQYTKEEHLDDREESKLSGDMRELYDRLLPSPESEARRKELIQKLDIILNEKWPGHTIKVNVFGSTGNKLGTTDSDVDICITTDLKELEHVCSLAELLASHGMERVVCVSSAKVPIVKIWDPELRLAVDMNVNNPIALENTEMIRTYVAIDDRVRPLAMIVKHWAKRRILNEPALGSTLSSYTWICMIINFLQTRDPPILPSLQQQPNLKRKIMHGIDVTFDKDVNLYSGFGKRNTDSLGELLIQFFRCYGHELDFETKVMSVRQGKVVEKSEKGWNFLQDNRLCVEEPFNTLRNLGNTADDTSMRGVHLELRRAYKLIAEGNLEKCCEQYEYPLDEGKTFEKFTPPESRPIIAQMPPPTIRGARNGGRAGKHTNNRGAHNANRRSSNVTRSVHPALRHFSYQMSPQEVQMQQQHQQFLLHDQLYQQYQYLQAQEQELRQQLHQQAFLQGRVTASMAYPHIAFPSYATSDSGQEDTNRVRAGTVNHPPLTAPVHQSRFSNASPYTSTTMPRMHGPTTNPPSPLLRSVGPDLHRPTRHASLTDPFPTPSLRAHSQPARPMPSPLSFQPVMNEDGNDGMTQNTLPQYLQPSGGSSARDALASYFTHLGGQRRASEYIGYYVGHSPPLQASSRASVASPVPSYSGLAIQHGGLSPSLFPQVPSYQSSVISPPPERSQSPVDDLVSRGSGSPGPSLASAVRQTPPQLRDKRCGPLVVNGSTPPHDRRSDVNGNGVEPLTGATFSGSTSEDMAFTPTSSEDHSQGLPETTDADLSLLSPHSHPEPEMNSLQHHFGSLLANGHKDTADLGFGNRPLQPSSARLSQQASKVKAEYKPVLNGIGKSHLQVQGNSQLSPVREVPVSSPNGDDRAGELLQTTTNGSGKAKNKSRQEKTQPQGSENYFKDEFSLQRSNGVLHHSVNKDTLNGATQASGWQTAKKKKHKKSAKSESDVNPAGILSGDFRPKDATLRKGG